MKVIIWLVLPLVLVVQATAMAAPQQNNIIKDVWSELGRFDKLNVNWGSGDIAEKKGTVYYDSGFIVYASTDSAPFNNEHIDGAVTFIKDEYCLAGDCGRTVYYMIMVACNKNAYLIGPINYFGGGSYQGLTPNLAGPLPNTTNGGPIDKLYSTLCKAQINWAKVDKAGGLMIVDGKYVWVDGGNH